MNIKKRSTIEQCEKRVFFKKTIVVAVCLVCAPTLSAQEANSPPSLEEIIVVAEKRNESLQDLSQAVTAISSNDLDNKNISSFIDLSAIAPGVTVSNNEGFKTVISIRGVGNEANQNATANPSVSYHADGIYIASPFALQTDFIDVERIEVLRGPQGTLFGQNSTGGAINVISKKPSFEEVGGKTDLTLGSDNLFKLRGTLNIPLSEKLATRTSASWVQQDGFTENIYNGPSLDDPSTTFTGQDLDDTNNFSFRTDWLYQANENLSLRFLAQYFNEDSNGAAIKGLDDPTPGNRQLSQDTESSYELDSQIYGLIAEYDIGGATIKSLTSYQKDDITIKRDNDRHSFLTNPEIQISEFDPETNLQTTFTQEFNVISNERLFDKVDWLFGVFYLNTDIEITIREELDVDRDGDLGGFALTNPEIFFPGNDRGFISDSNPVRESISVYGQTTFYASEAFRVITGLRYTDDEVESTVANFFTDSPAFINPTTKDVTGRFAIEYDLGENALVYGSYTRGLKPGGTNLTFSVGDDALVRESFEDETIDAYEIGLKTQFLDNRIRANISAFYYDYSNLQFQASDFNEFGSGVANIPESEIIGVELELKALLGDQFSIDLKMAALDSEISDDFLALDNRLLIEDVFLADGVTAAREEIHGPTRDVAGFLQNLNGNELAKTPGLTADLTLSYENQISSGAFIGANIQYTYRGSLEQRVFNNPEVDSVDSYDTLNATVSYDTEDGKWGYDLLAFNLTDEDGINSSMTDVFGVNETGLQFIAPRQIMARVRYSF